MRLVLSRAGLDNVWLNLIQGVCDTRRECRAWDKPGHPSTALPGKLNEEAECGLMFYKQGHNPLLIIDRCIRHGAGIKIP
eukprot:2913609-Pyramimonas_sp.AAC.1